MNSTYESARIERIVSLYYDKVFGIDLSHYQERDEIQWDSLYIKNKTVRYPLQFTIFLGRTNGQRKLPIKTSFTFGKEAKKSSN